MQMFHYTHESRAKLSRNNTYKVLYGNYIEFKRKKTSELV